MICYDLLYDCSDRDLKNNRCHRLMRHASGFQLLIVRIEAQNRMFPYTE